MSWGFQCEVCTHGETVSQADLDCAMDVEQFFPSGLRNRDPV